MRRHHLAVGLVGIAVLFAACGKGGGDLPLLPGAQNAGAGGEKAMASSAADSSMMVANIRYELADGVSTSTTSANAYNFADATKAQVEKLANAFGVGGAVKEDGDAWTAGGTDNYLYVTKNGGVFSLSREANMASGSSGCAVAPVAPDQPVSDKDMPSCDAPVTTTTVPVDAPTRDDAERIAKQTLRDAGVDTDNTKVTVESFDPTQQNVRFQYEVDGHVVDGLEAYVTVGTKNRVLSASGHLVSPANVGSYELASLTRAVERLNSSYGKARTLEARDDVAVAPAEEPFNTTVPGQEPSPATTVPPTVVKLTSVDVGLMMQSDFDGDLWLVPSYRFGTDADNGIVTTEAAADKYIQQAPTNSSPLPPADNGATTPAAPPSNCAMFDGDISGQVCASDGAAGQPVTFSITAADNDRGFASGCFDGVTVEYGDNGAGDVRCEACATDVPPGPGKLGVERTHTYDKAGVYTATFTIRSGADCGQSDPKDSTAKVSLTVKVA